MLQWNKKHAIILIFAVVCTLGAAAQENGPAILERGPFFVRGIEILEPNAMRAYFGEYVYSDSSVLVWYTQADVLLSDEWEGTQCSGETVFQRTGELGTEVFYNDEEGWKVFLVFAEDQSQWCRFFSVFITRFSYFLRATGTESGVSFPAVLEFQ